MRRALLAITLLGLATNSGCKRKELEAQLDKTTQQLTETETALTKQKAENEKLGKDVENYKGKVAALEEELATLNGELERLAAQQGITSNELEELRAEKGKRERELKVYKDLFAQLKRLVDAGTIEVVFRKGRMTVKLSNAILFDSGQARLRPEGEAAVAEIVPALQSIGDREFLVAGHTDNDPIKTARYKSNWELSTARAVSMVNAMVLNGYPPGRIGAAGFGEFDPISSNESTGGKEQNRRIEIILMPNLGEIPGLRAMIAGGS